MDFAAFPTALAAKYTGGNEPVNVVVHAVRPKGSGVEYLCVASDGKTYLLDAAEVIFSDVPAGDPVRLGKAKGAKKSH